MMVIIRAAAGVLFAFCIVGSSQAMQDLSSEDSNTNSSETVSDDQIGDAGERDAQGNKPAFATAASQIASLKNEIDQTQSLFDSAQNTLGHDHAITQSLLTKCGELSSMLLAAQAPPATDSTRMQIRQVLNYKPRRSDAVFEEPKYPLLASLSIVKSDPFYRGYELTYRGQIVRRLLDTNDDLKLDLFIYFKNGTESYRETDKDADETIESWQHTRGDAVDLFFDTDGDGKADERFEGNASDLRTLGMDPAIRGKVLKETRLPDPSLLLPAGLHKIEDSKVPKRLVASIGGFASRSFEVEFDNGKLTYRQNATGFTEWGGTSEEIQVTKEDWIRFRDQLNEAEVWKWRRRYENRKILDGTSWRLQIDYAEQSIVSSGSNANPEYKQFEKFLDAVSILVGKRSFK